MTETTAKATEAKETAKRQPQQRVVRRAETAATDTKYLAENRSRAFFSEKFTIRSHTVQFFFDQNKDSLNDAFYRLAPVPFPSTKEERERRDRIFEAREKEALQLYKEFDENITALCNKMKELENKIKEACDAAGVPAEKQIPNYNHARPYTMEIFAPQSRRFVDLMKAFDKLIARVEGAWLNGVAEQKLRRTTIDSWRDQIFELVINFKNKSNEIVTKHHE